MRSIASGCAFPSNLSSSSLSRSDHGPRPIQLSTIMTSLKKSDPKHDASNRRLAFSFQKEKMKLLRTRLQKVSLRSEFYCEESSFLEVPILHNMQVTHPAHFLEPVFGSLFRAETHCFPLVCLLHASATLQLSLVHHASLHTRLSSSQELRVFLKRNAITAFKTASWKLLWHHCVTCFGLETSGNCRFLLRFLREKKKLAVVTIGTAVHA
jgi:hypothetical protein